ncbi:MAG: lipopolysaccharide kinase InaA family protein [Polyangiales bacterium]
MEAQRSSPPNTTASGAGRLALGAVFVDRFEVRDFLGAGGEFDVFLAFDRARGEEVALKVLVLPGDPRFGQTVASTVADDLAARRDALDALVRLHRETLDAIDHDVAIARVWEASHEGDPSEWFIVEEAVASAYTLGDWLRIEKDETVVRRALGSLGRLLSQLHERGVVHRDVHGGNVLVDGEGRLWFTDFSHAIRPLHRGSFALLSPWNAPEERSNAPLTASADVYGFARLVLPVLVAHARRARDASRRNRLFSRLESLRARWIDCAPEARGSLVSLLDELAVIDRALAPRARSSPRRRALWSIAAALLLGLSAFAMNARAPSARALASSSIPVTEVPIRTELAPLEWRDGQWVRRDATTVSANEPAPSDAQRPTRRLVRDGFARGAVAFRGEAPASERLADYAAREFLREARLRASKGWGAACLRSRASSSEASATFRVTLSTASDAHGGRVDGVELVRSSGVDERVAQCLRARIANIAPADPGQTIATELSLRLSSSDERPVARR